MRRYIDAYKIPYHDLSDGKGLCQVAFLEDVIKVPTADVRENVRGEWIDCTEDGYVECPFCHSATNCDENKEELHFCFSCGADMGGKQE